MAATTLTTGRTRIPWLLLACTLAACSKKAEEIPPPPKAEAPSPPALLDSMPASDTVPEPGTSEPEAVAVQAETPKPAPRTVPKTGFKSRPALKAWPGRAYAYSAILAPARAFRLRLAQGPDSMKVSGTVVSWTPSKPGKFPVSLEALVRIGEGDDSVGARQTFVLEVEPVLSFFLKPLTVRADKGDTITFDLRASAYPEWAGASLTVRFDYEGDGTWDTPALPLPANLLHKHPYGITGNFSPKVEARYLDLEVRSAEGSLTVVSAVDAALKIRPDTAEPGGMIKVDASGSKGDGRLAYFLDLDGDGKVDWADSSSGKAALKAPASGKYLAGLTVRNPMGLEGKATAALIVNARPKTVLKIRNAKENMSAPVQALLEGQDADDSLRTLRVNFTGGKDAWVSASAPDTAKGPGRWRKVFKHAYGKVGKYTVEACAASADGRETCQKSPVEIFNAPPVCEPGPALKATLGVPAEIVGAGRDPDGSIVKWEWDLNGDGKFDVASKKDGKVKYTFARKGEFALTLKVTTLDGMTATATRKVEVRKKW